MNSSSTEFNFTGLSEIFSDNVKNNETTLAFQINNGNGKFVFMAFFDYDKKKGFENFLFFYCRNIRYMGELKLYGNPYKNVFKVFITETDKRKIIDELQLQKGTGNSFDFEQFLNVLNSQIPKKIQRKDKVKILKDNFKEIDLKKRKKLVDEANKIYLYGVNTLPSHKTPQDKTLRKLYLYIDGSSDNISDFINELVKLNKTVMWTDNPSLEKDFVSVVSGL
ncbi:hypothetical protein LXN10_01015 [Arcobacter sp. KX21116]|uniref:hypothetical protein n=1 Tax=Arcobacter iocasae TaxID=2906515 RepID=UPI0035D50363